MSSVRVLYIYFCDAALLYKCDYDPYVSLTLVRPKKIAVHDLSVQIISSLWLGY